MLLLEHGMRPIFQLTWHVLGKTADGHFSLAAEEPPLSAETEADQNQSLLELIG